MTITRLGPLSVAKVIGLLYLVIGLVFGGMFSLVAMAGGFAARDTEGMGPLAAVFGVGAVILFPICYSILGFVMSLIGTWLFNVAAGVTGGIEVDVK